jgi:hypothetical protein
MGGGDEVYLDRSLTSDLDGLSAHLQVPVVLPRRKALRYHLDRNFGELRSRFGHGDEEKRMCPGTGSKSEVATYTYNHSVTNH